MKEELKKIYKEYIEYLEDEFDWRDEYERYLNLNDFMHWVVNGYVNK